MEEVGAIRNNQQLNKEDLLSEKKRVVSKWTDEAVVTTSSVPEQELFAAKSHVSTRICQYNWNNNEKNG